MAYRRKRATTRRRASSSRSYTRRSPARRRAPVRRRTSARRAPAQTIRIVVQNDPSPQLGMIGATGETVASVRETSPSKKAKF